MGDRGNIAVEETGEKNRVYLYTHWRGSTIREVLQAALAKRWRWTDTAYLTRIIFCELVQGSEAAETGFGISPSVCDNEHPILVVNTSKQLVYIYSAKPPRRVLHAISFEDWAAGKWPAETREGG